MNHNRNNQQPSNNQFGQGPMSIPGSAPKSRYSTFYLIMLILASVVAFFTFIGFFTSVYSAVISFSDGKALIGALNIASIILGILSLVALTLLYMKSRVGFFMKIGLIVFSLALSLTTVFVAGSNFSQELNNKLDEVYLNSDQATMTPEDRQSLEDFKSFMNNYGQTLYLVFGSIFAVVSSGIALLLWCLAWRSQTKHDKA